MFAIIFDDQTIVCDRIDTESMELTDEEIDELLTELGE